MSDVAIPTFMPQLVSHYTRMMSRNATRDRHHELIHQVRRGNIRQLFPEELNFSISFQGSPISNFVDIVAHDMAEGIAPLPALACVSGKMQTDADQDRAERKNRIGFNYWLHCQLEKQMLKGADRYVTYGFLPIFIEPDFDDKLPFIHLEDPRYTYYEKDRFDCVKFYARRFMKSVDELAALFPELEGVIRRDPKSGMNDPGDTELQMVRWVDDKNVTLFLPQRDGLRLSSYAHGMKYAPVVIAERPSEDDNPRGQFDDVIWVQVARSIMSTLALEAASIAVQSPIAAPSDMDEFPVGPHAILQSDHAENIHKIPLELPQSIFAESALLDQELRVGSRYPEARSGQIDTSVITGKGVQAMLGTFDSQIKGAQLVLKYAFEKVTAMCFEMDETHWPDDSKVISGTLSGTSYEFTYTPAKDINGRYSCTVTYGFAAGLRDPAQSIVTMLQLEGSGLIAKGTTRANMPFNVDPVQEARQIDVEGSREALKQGVFALLGATGQMAAQGQDATQFIQMAVDMIRGLQDGDTVEDAVSTAFQSMQQRIQEAQQQAMEEQQEAAQGGDQGAPGGGGPVDLGFSGNGLPQGVAPGQAGLPPGGRPTLAEMVAGFRGNGSLPVNQYDIRRRVPTGT